VDVLGDLGNFNFTSEDLKTQEQMINKLDYVETSIKKLKRNIYDYTSKPYTSVNNTSQFNGTANNPNHSNHNSGMGPNFDLYQENEHLKSHLKSTQNEEIFLSKKFDDFIRSPVKEASHSKI
jgi:hypothetical protein